MKIKQSSKGVLKQEGMIQERSEKSLWVKKDVKMCKYAKLHDRYKTLEFTNKNQIVYDIKFILNDSDWVL